MTLPVNVTGAAPISFPSRMTRTSRSVVLTTTERAAAPLFSAFQRVGSIRSGRSGAASVAAITGIVSSRVTTTIMPSRLSAKSKRANASGRRMQPWEAG